MNKPRVRFKGYTDNWEQRKLGDVCEFLNGDRGENYPVPSDFQENGIPFVGSDALGYTEVNMEKVRFISNNKYKSMKGIKIQEGDILYTLRGAGFGKNALVDFNGGTVASSLVGIRSDKKYVKSIFLIQWFNSIKAHKEKNKAVNGSTAQNISVDDMKRYSISLPGIGEQERIGVYFHNLDHLITLHQHKCDETKTLKKYMLQKMFPQDGANVPEIRFDGFTDDWEQRKLSEIAVKVTEKNKDGAYSEPFTNSAELGIISQKDYFDREIVNEENLNSYYIVRNDDFVYNPRISVTAPVGPINRNRLGRNGVMSPLYTVFRTNGINNLYLEFYFKTTSWHKFMKLNGDSGARFDRFTIGSSQFMEMPIPYPTLEEQKKIGEYFENLDYLITLHQCKFGKLQNIKKFMLEKMFI